jgi:hypothetical protein
MMMMSGRSPTASSDPFSPLRGYNLEIAEQLEPCLEHVHVVVVVFDVQDFHGVLPRSC